jgi:hypothetical protein
VKRAAANGCHWNIPHKLGFDIRATLKMQIIGIKRFLPFLMILIFVEVSYGSNTLRNEQLKADSRSGYFRSCVPTIQSQNERWKLGLSQQQVMDYCVCMGIKIFDDLTTDEIDQMLNKKTLPERILSKHETFRNECSEEW